MEVFDSGSGRARHEDSAVWEPQGDSAGTYSLRLNVTGRTSAASEGGNALDVVNVTARSQRVARASSLLDYPRILEPSAELCAAP